MVIDKCYGSIRYLFYLLFRGIKKVTIPFVIIIVIPLLQDLMHLGTYLQVKVAIHSSLLIYFTRFTLTWLAK